MDYEIAFIIDNTLVVNVHLVRLTVLYRIEKRPVIVQVRYRLALSA